MGGRTFEEALAMRHVLLGILLGLGAACVCLAAPRQWTDSTGKFQVEATLVTVKDGKVYLEKSDGKITAVEIDKLSKADLDYLLSLPEHRGYFEKNPVAGMKAPAGGSKSAAVRTPDEPKVGEVRRFTDLGFGLRTLAFSPDGALLAVGKMDGALLVLDVDKGARTGSVEQRDALLGEVSCLAFTPDGKKLLSGRRRGRIQVWNVGPQGGLTEAGHFAGHSSAVHTITVGSDGRTVISGSEEKKLRCWELDSARERFAIDSFQHAVKASWLARSLKQALATDGQTLVLIDVQQGKELQSMKLANLAARATAISRDGSRVAISDLAALRVRETRTGLDQPALQDDEPQWSAQFLPNGKYLLSGANGKVNLWDLQSHQKVYEFDMAEGRGPVQTIACSSDNRRFAAMPFGGGQAIQVFRLPAEVEK
jgi:WD40 repeat protein